MMKISNPWYFRWIIFLLISILTIIFSNPFVVVDTILLLSVSLILFIIHSFYSDSFFLYISSTLLIGAIISSSIGRNPFSAFTLLTYSLIIFLALIFIVFSLERNFSGPSIRAIIINSSASILISLLFIFTLSDFIILRRDVISLTVMLIIIILSIYFLLESLEG